MTQIRSTVTNEVYLARKLFVAKPNKKNLSRFIKMMTKPRQSRHHIISIFTRKKENPDFVGYKMASELLQQAANSLSVNRLEIPRKSLYKSISFINAMRSVVMRESRKLDRKIIAKTYAPCSKNAKKEGKKRLLLNGPDSSFAMHARPGKAQLAYQTSTKPCDDATAPPKLITQSDERCIFTNQEVTKL